MRREPRELPLIQPKLIAIHDGSPPSGTVNHETLRRGIHFMGPEPS
jgi:hypothetical protein